MIIHTFSGLTSRIKTILQAYELVCDKGDDTLTIIWPYEKACRIPFWKVFDKDYFCGKTVIIIEGQISPMFPDYSVKKQLKKGYLLKTVYDVFNAYRGINFIKQKKVNKMQNDALERGNYYSTDLPSDISWPDGTEGLEAFNEWNADMYRKISNRIDIGYSDELYIHAYSGFGYRIPDYTKMRFCDEYYQIVNEYLKKEVEYIGIHIRRGDHDTCRKINKTDEFYKIIDEEIKTNSQVSLVLATDSIEEEKNMITRYGDRVVTQGQKELDRNKEKGIQASIIDLLLLSKCKYIIGSEGSMYSLFAAKLGGIELKYAHEKIL